MSIDYNSCIDNLNYDATQKTVFLKEYVRTGRYTIAELQIAQITDDLDAIGKATLLGDNERRQICDTLKLLRESVGGITTNHEKISALFQGLVAKIESLESSLDPEITAKSGFLWECVGREPNIDGNQGYIYKFRDKYEFHNDDLNKKHFPAVEPEAWFYSKMDKAISSSEVFPEMKNLSIPNLWYLAKEAIGMKTDSNSDGSFYLYLPDREALIACWEKYREKHSGMNLPPIDIISSEGIADDLLFVRANIDHDGLLSSGKEFVHDLTAHILPLVFRILSAAHTDDHNNYHNREGLKQIYDNIMITKKHIEEQTLDLPDDEKILVITHIDKIVAALGAAVDTQSSQIFINDSSYMFRRCEEKCYEPHWDVYFKDKFADMPNLDTLREVHDLIEMVAESGK